jgi:hypothetical protein
MFVSVGLVEEDPLCQFCATDSERFYQGEAVEEGDTVQAKHFKGILVYKGSESSVEVTSSENRSINEGDEIPIDSAYLKKM